MSSYIVEIAYVHTQDEIDWREVEAESRIEAQVVAETLFRRERYPNLRDVAVVSVTAEEVGNRYSLNLYSDADDLDLEEVE